MFSHRSSPEPVIAGGRAGIRSGSLLILLALSLVLTGLLFVSGCGGGGSDKESEVLATVGDVDITAAYYESKLGKLELNELPKGDDGMPMDMAQLEGKRKFLETLIQKELMALKGRDLGYESDPQIEGLKTTMLKYEAEEMMWNEVVNVPAGTVSPEELEAFYERMGEIRNCSYILTNFESDAIEAREYARSGADWDDVAAKYHEGGTPPSGRYEMAIPYGRYNMRFDTDVFETEVGDVAPPIETEYGYWVLRVNSISQEPKPSLEEAKVQILDTYHNRSLFAETNKFLSDLREKYQVFIDEDALWIAYSGLPEGEVILDPKTQKPVPREELQPLEVPAKELDRVFYGYTMDGEKKEWTILDYKTYFDNMNVFDRPKSGEMLGGMRQKILRNLQADIVAKEAEERGYYENPVVLEKVNNKVEEAVVTSLYDDVVTYDDKVTAEDVQSFWDAHEAEFAIPELRSGRLVICANEETAAEARDFIATDPKWRDVLTRYGIDAKNKSRSGKLDRSNARSLDPSRQMLFELEAVGDISQPFKQDNLRWGVVRLDLIEEPRARTLDEVRAEVSARIKGQRREEAFQNLLSKWAEEYGVVRHEDKLVDVASWEELTRVEVQGELLPR